MSEVNWFPIILSFRISITATLVAMMIGIPIAYLLSRSQSRWADMMDTLFTLPIVLPPTVLGYYLLVLLGRQSFIGRFLEEQFDLIIVFTPTAAVLAASIVSVPYLMKTARTAFSEIDPHLIHAAKILGGNEWRIFVTIVVPLAWRGILSGIILAFARALGDFGTTLMVAGSIPNQTLTMPIAIYDALQSGNLQLTNTLVLIMTILSLTVLFTLNRLEKRMTRRR